MLRGVNVGGQKRVKMQELRELCESLGLKGVETYVQSGNAVFNHAGTDIPSLASKIEEAIRRSFGFDVRVFIRTRVEFQALVAKNPFAGRDESKLHVTFLSDVPASLPLGEISDARVGAEEFSISERAVYLLCPNGYGRTKLNNNFFERKLKVAATTRNWNTVNALLSMTNR